MWTLDIETTADERMLPVLCDRIKAPSNYSDPVKIASYERDKRASAGDDAAAKIDFNRVLTIGLHPWTADGGHDPIVVLDTQEASEADILSEAWYHLRSQQIVGFCCRTFDLPVMLRRSQVLGVTAPSYSLTKYGSSPLVIDLADRLTWGGLVDLRALSVYCAEFGIPEGSEDTFTGADIPRLAREGRWVDIVRHVSCDVQRTSALARRLGIHSPVASAVGF